MRVFLEVVLLAAFISFGMAYVPGLIRRWKTRKRPPPAPGPVPVTALRWAPQDERLREAVELRGRIAELAEKPDVGLDAAVVREVDELLRAMADLFEMKSDLKRHLDSISEERLARDEALLDAASVVAQRKQIEGLRQRERALEAELARAVTGLRESWLGLLDALAQPGTGMIASERVREQIEALRIRVQAEREARAIEPVHASGGSP